MLPVRRLWCSCTIIDYLAGKPRAKSCELIVNQAERKETEIVVSILAEAEVVKLDGELDLDSEGQIREFFGRDYVIRTALDLPIVEQSRDLVRRFLGLKPLDAVHIATALHHSIPILETYDEKMIEVGERLGLTARNPTYEGTLPLLEQSSG